VVGVGVSGLTNENVGSIDGFTVANETVGSTPMGSNGAAVDVGTQVGVAGIAVAGGGVGVLGMLWGAQAANSVNPNKRTMNLQS